jgi:hypothetical protein
MRGRAWASVAELGIEAAAKWLKGVER